VHYTQTKPLLMPMLLCLQWSSRLLSTPQSAAVERVKGEAEARHASEREAFGRAALEAADHLRRLENANYALRVQLEQMAPSGNGSGQLPRWGEGY